MEGKHRGESGSVKQALIAKRKFSSSARLDSSVDRMRCPKGDAPGMAFSVFIAPKRTLQQILTNGMPAEMKDTPGIGSGEFPMTSLPSLQSSTQRRL